MKKKRLLCLALALAVIAGMTGVGSALAAESVTLHTGGGVIVNSDWRVSAGDNYTYTGSGALPTPQMAGAAFEGWYTNIGLTEGEKAAGATAGGGDYYAKWTAIQSGDNGKMSYTLTQVGGSAMGYRAGEPLRSSYCDIGFITEAMHRTLAAPGSGVDYSNNGAINAVMYTGGTLNFGLSDYAAMDDTDVYALRTMNLEGSYVRLTYYLTNRGGDPVTNLHLGASMDSMVGDNTYAPITTGVDAMGSYLRHYDAAAGNELRLYYKGDSVTDTDRLWYGSELGQQNKNTEEYTHNTFNSGRDGNYKEGMDTAFSFSWTNLSIAPGETQKYSVLFAVGAAGTLEHSCSLRYDTNGGAWTGAAAATVSYASGDVADITENVPAREDYDFKGWSFEPSATGALYQFGTADDKVPVLGDTTLYAIWAPTPHTATVTLKQDNAPLAGQKVTLVKDDIIRYTLTYDGEAQAYIEKPITDGGTTTGGVITGEYRIFINDVDSGETLAVGKTDAQQPVNFRSANVALTMEDAPWAGQAVTLCKDGTKLYTLDYKDGTYTKGLIPADTYDIYVNGADTGADLDLSDEAAAEASFAMPYYTAVVDLTLDGKPWTAQNITIGTQRAQYKNNAYTAVVLGEQTVKQGETALGTVSAASKTLDAAFYTVTFHSGAEKTKELVRKDGTVASFAATPDGDYTLTGWSLTVGGEAADFPYTVEGTTDFYAILDKPVVVPGAYQKLTASTYKCPNLTIAGYGNKTISSMKIEIESGGGSIALESDNPNFTIEANANNTAITVLCTQAVTPAVAAALLRTAVFTLGSGEQTVAFTAFAE